MNRTNHQRNHGRKNQSHSQKEYHTNIWTFSLVTGFFAGLIWGGVQGLFYYMRFTTVLPGYLVEPFFKNSFLHSQAGYYVGWLGFIIFSILVTLIYTLVFRNLKGPMPGILYGMVWWALIFLVIGPSLHMTTPIRTMTTNTFISEFCLYLLWGLFIGYTVAEEYTDERGREPETAY